jgi:hypothetical protein
MENRGAVKIMAGIILRWSGGAGGDTLCHLLSLQNTNVYMNFSCHGKIEPKTGQTLVSGRYDPDYPLLVQLTRVPRSGIGMMHKSNLVPVWDEDGAKEISTMRRN